jgi:hypothetical protein
VLSATLASGPTTPGDGYRLERLRRRGETATFSSNASSLPFPGAAQLVALLRRITDAGALEDGEYLWKQTIRSSSRAAADADMPSGLGAIGKPGGIYSTSRLFRKPIHDNGVGGFLPTAAENQSPGQSRSRLSDHPM